MIIIAYIRSEVLVEGDGSECEIRVTGDEDCRMRVMDMIMGALWRMDKDIWSRCEVNGDRIRISVPKEQVQNCLLAMEQGYGKVRRCAHNIHELVHELLRRGAKRNQICKAMGICSSRLHYIIHSAESTVSADTAYNLRTYIEQNHPDMLRDWAVAAVDSKRRNPKWLR